MVSDKREQLSGKQLLNRINQVSFAVDDLLLYLDTHPCDERALMLCRKMVKERKELLEKYAQNFGPSYYRLYGYVRVRELEMDGTAISLGKGRRMQIAYVEL